MLPSRPIRRTSPPGHDRPPRRGASRRGAARRSAVAVLTGLAAFAALQAGAAAAIELWFPGVIDPAYRVRSEQLRAGGPSGDEGPVVMLGSSLTHGGLDADAASALLSGALGRPTRVANFGLWGAGPLTELLTWRRLRREGVHPRLLLVEVNPFLLCDHYVQSEVSEARMPASRLSLLEVSTLKRYGGRCRSGLRRDCVWTDLNCLYVRRVGILDALAPDLLWARDGAGAALLRQTGRVPELTPEQRRATVAEQQPGMEVALRQVHPGGPGCAPLEGLLREARAAGVPTALVLMPESAEMRASYPPGGWQALATWLEGLGRGYASPLVAARDWCAQEDFADLCHLKAHGAKVFTERLGREHLVPLLRRASWARRGSDGRAGGKSG